MLSSLALAGDRMPSGYSTASSTIKTSNSTVWKPAALALRPENTQHRLRWDASECSTVHVPTSCRTKTARLSRSEEHTSELQSRGHLVCRLLLEKKKIRT